MQNCVYRRVDQRNIARSDWSVRQRDRDGRRLKFERQILDRNSESVNC